MENGTSGGEGQGNTSNPPHPHSPTLKDHAEVRKARSKYKPAQRLSCKPRAAWSKTRWALMTSGDVRRFNRDQVRSTEGALLLEALTHVATIQRQQLDSDRRQKSS